MNQPLPSAPTSQAEFTHPSEPSAAQEPSPLPEESFLLPRSAWARPITRLRILMQVKRLLDHQEAKFEQHQKI